MPRLKRRLFILVLLLSTPLVRAQEADGPLPPPKSEPEWNSPLATKSKVLLAPGSDDKALHWELSAKSGAPVVAARTGVVTRVVNHSNVGGPKPDWEDDANTITVRHSDGSTATYACLLRSDSPPLAGDVVLRGEQIGRAGSTGMTDGGRLHFSVTRVDGDDAPVALIGLDDDTLAPANEPNIPQELIDAYKTTLRRHESARAAGHRDVAVVLTAAELRSLGRKRRDDYWVHRELLRRGRAVADELSTDVTRLINLDRPDLDDAVLAFRYKTVLKSIKSMTKECKQLDAVVKRTPGQRTFLGGGNASKFATLYAKGIFAGHTGDLEAAIEHLGKASKGPDALASAAVTEARRIIEAHTKYYDERIERLERESERARSADRSAVRRESEALFAETVALHKVLKKACPTERAVAETAMVKAREKRKKIADALK